MGTALFMIALRCRSAHVVVTALVLLAVVPAWSAADPIVFSAGDPGASSTDPRPNADAAALAFTTAAGALGSVGPITFESSPTGAFANLPAAPGVSINGSDINGNNQTILDSPHPAIPEPLFGYNSTAGGNHFVSLFGGDLVFTFAKPIQAFGAYLTGVQFGGQSITFDDGTSQTVPIPNVPAGGVLFVGFTDAGRAITSLTINAAGDTIGVDDVRIVLAETPEPASLALFGAAAFGAAAYGWRRRRP